uniref:Uncharacterized protein n=1 Tax=Arundo donax TaxID=35708 RepID=A0A0A8YE28_ARUDO
MWKVLRIVWHNSRKKPLLAGILRRQLFHWRTKGTYTTPSNMSHA